MITNPINKVPTVSYSTQFTDRTGVSQTKEKAKRVAIYGHLNSDTNEIPPQYMIHVSSVSESNSDQVIVRAPLQDEIAMNVGGRWEPMMGMNFLRSILENASQLLGGVTLMRPWMTTRMWKGTGPMELSLTLRFNAVEDAEKNVVAACAALQSMALPRWVGDPTGDSPQEDGTQKKVFLSPPGPSAFKHFPALRHLAHGSGERITIQIGRLVLFSSVIIKEVNVKYKNRMDWRGNPISAEANIQFESYQIMTKEELASAYDMVRYDFENDSVADWMKENLLNPVVDKTVDLVKEGVETIQDAWKYITVGPGSNPSGRGH